MSNSINLCIGIITFVYSLKNIYKLYSQIMIDSQLKLNDNIYNIIEHTYKNFIKEKKKLNKFNDEAKEEAFLITKNKIKNIYPNIDDIYLERLIKDRIIYIKHSKNINIKMNLNI